jgi:hypothetical protein
VVRWADVPGARWVGELAGKDRAWAISSTYSILISRIAAARIGRDAAVEWMSVAAIPARDRVLQVEPERRSQSK